GRTGAALRLARNPAARAEIERALDFAETIPGSPPLCALKVGETIRKLATGASALADGATSPAPTAVSGPASEENGEPAPKERVGRGSLGAVIDLLAAFYRDLLALRLGGADATIIHEDRRDRLKVLAERRTPERWMACLESI